MAIHRQPKADIHGAHEAQGMLLEALLAELRSVASEAEERGFLLAVGRRIAAACPLGDVSDLDGVSDHMNRVWQQLEGAQVRLTAGTDGIAIEHRLPGGTPATDPVVVEGIYAGWFETLGTDRLALRRVPSAPQTLAFHYGR